MTFMLTEAEKTQAAENLSWWLDLRSDPSSMHAMRQLIKECFPGCESLYISLQKNAIMEHAELDNEKIPKFLVDMTDIELFAHEHGAKIRQMLLSKLAKKDPWRLKKFDKKIEAKDWNDETAKTLLEKLITKNWSPGGAWARKFIEIFGFPSKFSGIVPPPKPENVESIEKRPHLNPLENFQENIKSQILHLLTKDSSNENRCIVRLPTGAGKTRTAVEGVLEYWKNKPSNVRWVVWIANKDELCEQALQCFRQIWEEFGEEGDTLNIYRVWGGRYLPDPNDEGIIVAGIDQLHSIATYNDNQPEDELQSICDDVGLIVIDEAHHAIAPTYSRVLKSFGLTMYPDGSKQTPLLGLTATPFRSSDHETHRLRKKFGENILHPSPNFPPKGYFSDQWNSWNFMINKLTDEEILSIPHFHYIDTDSVFKMDRAESVYLSKKNLLHPDLLNRVGLDTKRNLEVFKIIKEWADKDKTILFFGANLNQAVMMSKFLNDSNISSAVITGKTKSGTRQSYVRMFRENKIQVLCNYQVLTTGFDAPKIDAIIIARPTGSRSLYEQMMGRGLRGPTFGGTKRCEIITVIDNILNYESRRVILGYEEYAESTNAVDYEEMQKIRTAAERFSAHDPLSFTESS